MIHCELHFTSVAAKVIICFVCFRMSSIQISYSKQTRKEIFRRLMDARAVDESDNNIWLVFTRHRSMRLIELFVINLVLLVGILQNRRATPELVTKSEPLKSSEPSTIIDAKNGTKTFNEDELVFAHVVSDSILKKSMY